MLRRLFTIASATSLLLCVATAVLWVRSGGVIDMFRLDRTSFSANAISSRGEVLASFERRKAKSLRAPGWMHVTLQPATSLKDFVFGYMSFSLHARGAIGFYVVISPDSWGLMLPDWSLVCVTALLPTYWVVAFINPKRRRLRGRCVTCGYDLTGNTSGVCPECGVDVDPHGVPPATV